MTPEQFNEIIMRLDALIALHQPVKPMQAYSVEHVAEKLNISRSTVLRAINNKQLRPSRLGDWRITDEQLREWLESRRPIKRRKM